MEAGGRLFSDSGRNNTHICIASNWGRFVGHNMEYEMDPASFILINKNVFYCCAPICTKTMGDNIIIP